MAKRARHSLAEVQAQTKKSNFIYNVFARPSEPVTYLIANFTPLSANVVSLFAGASGLLGSALYIGEARVLAALAFAAFFLLDCCDGAIARLRGASSRLGARLDLACDRVVLAVAALTFGVSALSAGDRTAATLCATYFAAHCCLDWLWYRSERQFGGHPHQTRQLIASLEAQRFRDTPSAPHWLHMVSRVEAAIRPSPWVCNIVFLIGACLFPTAQAAVFLAAIAGLVWFNRAPILRARLRSGLMSP